MQMYWTCIQIVAKAGGNYGPSFQSHHRVTQVDPLSPTIFNVVVETIIGHWMAVVSHPQEGSLQKGMIISIQDLSEILYSDN